MSQSSKNDQWYQGVVMKGSQLGRTIGFPTANLDNPGVLEGKEQGVYASRVKIEEKEYLGALYYGPRLVVKETKVVLEIHILDFDQDIYGKTLAFHIGPYVRGIMDFDSLDSLKKQLVEDCEKIKTLLKADSV